MRNKEKWTPKRFQTSSSHTTQITQTGIRCNEHDSITKTNQREGSNDFFKSLNSSLLSSKFLVPLLFWIPPPCLFRYLFLYSFFFIFLLILPLSIGCTLLQLRGMGRWCVGVLWSVLILFPSCKVLNDNQSQLPSLGDNVDREVGIDLWRGLQVVFSHSTNLTYSLTEKNTDLERTEWKIVHVPWMVT